MRKRFIKLFNGEINLRTTYREGDEVWIVGAKGPLAKLVEDVPQGVVVYDEQEGAQRAYLKQKSGVVDRLKRVWGQRGERTMNEKMLYKKLVRLAYTNPGPVRDALMPLLKGKTGSGEELLSPGESSSHPEVLAFMDDLEGAFRKSFPRGYFGIKAEKKFGQYSIYVATATLPRGQQANKIIQNDPSYNTFWMHDSYDQGGIHDKIQIEISQGGSLYEPNARNRQKVGWRNGTGSPDAVVRKFAQYFAKLKSMIDANPAVQR